jgi:hypothetical protein
MRPGLNFCEVCGTPAGYIEMPGEPRSYKWLIVVGIVIVALGGAIAGYHFWGVKMTIDVNANPAGDSRVYLDGKALGSTQGRLVVTHVLRGEHTIRVERDGFDSQTKTIKIGLLDFTSAVPIEMSRTSYTLTIRNTPNDPSVKILLEDQNDLAAGQKAVGTWDAGKSAYLVSSVYKGESYTLVLKRAGYRDYKEEIAKLSDNKEVRPDWVVSMAGEWSGTYIDNSGTTPLETRFTMTLSDSGTATSSTSSARFTGTIQDGVSNTVSEATITPSSRYVTFKVVKGENSYTFYGYLGADLMKLQDGSWYVSGPSFGSGSWSMTRTQATTR